MVVQEGIVCREPGNQFFYLLPLCMSVVGAGAFDRSETVYGNRVDYFLLPQID